MVARWRLTAMVAMTGAGLAACVPDQPRNDEQRPVTAAPADAAAVPAAPTPLMPVSGEPLALDKVIMSIRSGTQIGAYEDCLGCPGRAEPIYWDPGRLVLRPAVFVPGFHDTMSRAGYRVAGNPSRLFDAAAERSAARYLVGADIHEMTVSIERSNYIFVGPRTRASIRLSVNWQVYSLRDRRLVHEARTQGSYTLERPNHDSILTALVLGAFGDATTKFGFDARLRRTVAEPAGVVEAAATMAPPVDDATEIPRFAAFRGAIGERLATLRGGTVTIFTASGQGSGFFVSDSGHILTNQHVVGEADRVNVRLISGVEVGGRVLRRDAVRDVALVKTELGRAQALPLRPERARIGEEVYAIGSPIREEFAGSVTRGIVSAFRRESRGGAELDLIQSDVAIQGGNSGGPLLDASGNVIGIAVSGFGAGNKLNVGLNFFIPIHDALERLSIRLGEARPLPF